MILKEEKRNIFTVDDKYYFAHCISKDANMGAGIAVAFKKEFSGLSRLSNHWELNEGVGGCMLVDKVFNLITKERYWHKPNYQSLQTSLISMKVLIHDNKVKYLAMPKIGCGLDRLQWGKVREIIEEVFEDTDIEILVCHL